MKASIILGIVLFSMMMYGWYFFAYQPLIQEINQKRVVLNQLQNDKKKALQAQQELCDLQSQVDQKKETLSILLTDSPKNLIECMAFFTGIARQSNIQIQSCKPIDTCQFAVATLGYFEEHIRLLNVIGDQCPALSINKAILTKQNSSMAAEYSITCTFYEGIGASRSDRKAVRFQGPLRDPFSFADEEKQPECLAIGQVHNTHQSRAIIRHNGKRYTVRVGNVFEGYRVEAILQDSVTLVSPEKKALQLIIS